MRLSCRWLGPLAGVLVLSLGVGRASAQPNVTPVAPAATAADHAARGQRAFELHRYEDAIAELRKGYEINANPTFLRDIGRSYEALGLADRALFFYHRYLAAAPTTADHAEVEGAIARIEPRATPRDTTTAAPLTARASTPPPATAPLWKRWWFWTAVGATAALAIGVTALARAGNDHDLPQTDLGNHRFF